jgi:hypothetical protein
MSSWRMRLRMKSRAKLKHAPSLFSVPAAFSIPAKSFHHLDCKHSLPVKLEATCLVKLRYP